MLHLKVIVGSTRPKRFSEQVVPWVQAVLALRREFSVEVLDLREYPLPYYDQPISAKWVKDGAYGSEAVLRWAPHIKDADVFLVITPEYNHGYPAVLKNAFDVLYHEWAHKAIGFISYGSVGGACAVEQLKQVAVELNMAPVSASVTIIAPWHLVDEGGTLKQGSLDSYQKSFECMLDQLSWWGNALKEARIRDNV